MEYAVISDVHGNLEALEAVLADLDRRERTSGEKRALLFLGDAVGYGPNPNECLAAIKKRVLTGVAGNHDRAVLGLTGSYIFNPYAREAILWTREVLLPENRAFLEGFPLVNAMEEDGLFLVHASPREPEKWRYLLDFSQASENFEYFRERICLIGHSHLPFVSV